MYSLKVSMVKIDASKGLQLHHIHVFFLERAMEHEWALFRATITLSRKNTLHNRKPSLVYMYMYALYY